MKLSMDRISDHDVPLVSVLMPAYNHERYVEAAIRSVLAQDWPNLELIVLDDGSSDGTWDVLQRLLPDCTRRLRRVSFERQENCGTCETMNRICGKVQGSFVGILASDDEYLPGAISTLVRPMMADPSIGVVVGQNEIMDGDGRQCFWDAERNVFAEGGEGRYETFNAYISMRRGVREDSEEFGSYASLLKANHVANGALIRTSALERILPFSAAAPLEDYWMHLQLSKVTQYRAVHERTFRYRWHGTNTIRQRQRMWEFFQQTLRWEEDRVAEVWNNRWSQAFRAAYWSLTAERGIRGLVTTRRYESPWCKCRTIRFLGHEFILSRKRRR